MTVTLSPTIKQVVAVTARDYGYRSKKFFIEDAIRHWILTLQKENFLTSAKKVRKRMTTAKLTEREILEDFDKFSHSK